MNHLQAVGHRFIGLIALLGKAQKAFMNWIISFNPNKERKDEPLSFNWADWRSFVKAPHFLVAVNTIIGVYVIYQMFVAFFPVTRFSIVTGLAATINWAWSGVTHSDFDITTHLIVAILLLLILFRRQLSTVFGSFEKVLKNLPQYAMREEVLFRKWTEEMTLWQKIQSCLTFGAAHFAMLVVPVAALPALTFGGAMFMLVYWLSYRRTRSQTESLLHAATTHTTYNALLLTAVLVWIFFGDILYVYHFFVR